jgi:hypothetical protein
LKRRDASIVFGIIHRDSNQRYKFVITSWEEIAKQFRRSVNMSIGEVVLKFLEQYIYNCPEEWYQWKKYFDIRMPSVPGTKVEIPKSPSLVKPAFSRIS